MAFSPRSAAMRTSSGVRALSRFVAALAAFALTIQPVAAQSILRDAETEALLNEMAAPLVRAAGLDPRNVAIVLVGDPSVNAFVAPAIGQGAAAASGPVVPTAVEHRSLRSGLRPSVEMTGRTRERPRPLTQAARASISSAWNAGFSPLQPSRPPFELESAGRALSCRLPARGSRPTGRRPDPVRVSLNRWFP